MRIPTHESEYVGLTAGLAATTASSADGREVGGARPEAMRIPTHGIGLKARLAAATPRSADGGEVAALGREAMRIPTHESQWDSRRHSARVDQDDGGESREPRRWRRGWPRRLRRRACGMPKRPHERLPRQCSACSQRRCFSRWSRCSSPAVARSSHPARPQATSRTSSACSYAGGMTVTTQVGGDPGCDSADPSLHSNAVRYDVRPAGDFHVIPRVRLRLEEPTDVRRREAGL